MLVSRSSRTRATCRSGNPRSCSSPSSSRSSRLPRRNHESMRRLELVFGAIVTALAVFVAVEARGARRYSAYLGGAVSRPLASSSEAPKRSRPADAPVPAKTAKPRDVEEIRRLLREGAPGTYVNELLIQRDSSLA